MKLTDQEKKFADYFVFLYFHNPAYTPKLSVCAAEYAGYEIPQGYGEAVKFVENLKEKCADYIESERNRIYEILDVDNRLNLWNVIINSEPKKEDIIANGFSSSLYLH